VLPFYHWIYMTIHVHVEAEAIPREAAVSSVTSNEIRQLLFVGAKRAAIWVFLWWDRRWLAAKFSNITEAGPECYPVLDEISRAHWPTSGCLGREIISKSAYLRLVNYHKLYTPTYINIFLYTHTCTIMCNNLYKQNIDIDKSTYYNSI